SSSLPRPAIVDVRQSAHTGGDHPPLGFIPEIRAELNPGFRDPRVPRKLACPGLITCAVTHAAETLLRDEYFCGLLLANHLYIAPALLMRGAHRRRSCKAEQGVASPERFATARGRTTPSTPGATTPRAAIAAWSRKERKQNAGPGPKNVTVERREARRRVAPTPGSRLERK